jgi:hypothetical protein
VVLYQGDDLLERGVAPVAIPQGQTNFWGVKSAMNLQAK